MFHDINFTRKAFNAAIAINGVTTEYRVIGKPHLRLVVHPSGKKPLMVRHSFNRQRKSKNLGSYPMMPLAVFEQLANEFIETMESGGNYSLALKVTLDQYVKQVYLPDAMKTKRSWADDESRYRLYVAPAIGEKVLAKIKPYHVKGLLDSLPEHLSDRSHDLIRALMSVIFNKLISHELIFKNPCRTTSSRNNCNAIERYMGELECTAFINACLVEVDIESASFSFQSLCLLFALLTGVRIGNCITLKRSMLAKDQTEVYLPTTKSKKPQTIYLSSFAQWVIQQALSVSNSEFVFPSALGKTGHITHPASSFRRICARAGIACSGSSHEIKEEFPSEVLTIHCLRKTFATVILNNDSVVHDAKHTHSLTTVSSLLGHANTSITRKHYAFSDGVQSKYAVEAAAQSMFKKITNMPNLKNPTMHQCNNLGR